MRSQALSIEIYESKIVLKNKDTHFQKTFFIDAFYEGSETAYYFCDDESHEIKAFHEKGVIYKIKIDDLEFIKEIET